MFVYNVTIKIEKDIEADWLAWQQREHLPEMMATGCFVSSTLYHLLHNDEPHEVTYVAQFFADTGEALNRYLEEEADALRRKSRDKWGPRMIAFRTIMETVAQVDK